MIPGARYDAADPDQGGVMMAILVQASMCDRKPGLGNRMFSWARAEVFSRRYGARMIAPQWTQFKLGPLLRRETDLRYYTNLFNNQGYIRGPRRWITLAMTPRVKGEEAQQLIDEIGETEALRRLDGKVVEFRGYEGWFRDDLRHHRPIVTDRLRAITSKAVRRQIDAFTMPTEIVAHVRRGDMRVLAPGEGFEGRPILAESEEYFIAVIEQIRSAAGDLPVTIFSNARPGELTKIPSLPGVHLVPTTHAALTDIWLMSRARVLIASSSSSFSAWASYLGGMPTVWHRPNRLDLVPGRPELAIEVAPDGVLDENARGVIRDFQR